MTFGAWGVEDDRGVPARWTSGRVTLFVRPASAPLRLPMRAMLGRLGGVPARVQARVNSHVVVDMVLSDERWRCPQVPVAARAVSLLKRSAVVELDVSPVWVPAEVFPGSADTRELGIRLGTVGASCPG